MSVFIEFLPFSIEQLSDYEKYIPEWANLFYLPFAPCFQLGAKDLEKKDVRRA